MSVREKEKIERGRDHRQRSGIEEGGCWTMVEELSLRELQPPNLHKVPSLPRWLFFEMRKTRRTLIEENTYFSFQVEDPIANTSSISIGSLNSRDCGVSGSLSVRRWACYHAPQRQDTRISQVPPRSLIRSMLRRETLQPSVLSVDVQVLLMETSISEFRQPLQPVSSVKLAKLYQYRLAFPLALDNEATYLSSIVPN